MARRLGRGLLAGTLALVIWACGDDGEVDADAAACRIGSLRCACYRDDTCDEGLACLSDRCVVRAAGGENGGEPGAGGEASSSGGATSAGGDASLPDGGTAPAQGGTPPTPSDGASGGEAASGGSAPEGGRDGSGGAAGASAGGMSGSGGSDPGTSAGSGGESGAGGALSDPVFVEDFEDGDADGWTNTDAAWHVVQAAGNSAYGPSGSANIGSAVAGDAEWTDVYVEARFRFVQVEDPGATYVVVGARYDDIRNGDYVLLWANGTGALSDVHEPVPDTVYNLSADITVTPLGNEWHTIGVEIQGTTLTGYFDGDPVAVLGADAIRTQGGIGLSVGYGLVEFDDVKVWLLP